jgi:predicted solute-binding protein
MRIGTVPYYNALPLTHFLDAEIVKATPSDLPTLLKQNRVDVALIPIGATLKENYYLYPECGLIGCDGFVGSVGFFTKPWMASLRQVKTVCWDAESKTSNLLGDIILKWETETKISQTHNNPDAQLLIGDKALFDASKRMYWDLGECWKKYTGFGFIFACWASQYPLSEAHKAKLTQARDKGCTHLDEVLSTVQTDKRVHIKKYFNQQIKYQVTDSLLNGWQRFRFESGH